MFINFVKLKKMKLENLNLVELNAQEKKSTEGGNGFWQLIGAIVGVIGTCGKTTITHHNSEYASNFQSCTGGTKW
jgi:hypothetical protein